jgi:hypothetical protein
MKFWGFYWSGILVINEFKREREFYLGSIGSCFGDGYRSTCFGNQYRSNRRRREPIFEKKMDDGGKIEKAAAAAKAVTAALAEGARRVMSKLNILTASVVSARTLSLSLRRCLGSEATHRTKWCEWVSECVCVCNWIQLSSLRAHTLVASGRIHQ